VPGFVAAQLAGVEADSYEEAWDRAAHDSDIEWEVAACVRKEMASYAVEAIVTSTTPARVRRSLRKRPLFGKVSVVALPMLAYGAFTDTSALGAVLGAVAALGGF
jgi:hypothetical protein